MMVKLLRVFKLILGYCPPGQIPYTGVSGTDMTPPTCHMTLSLCPTTAAYSCIYSAEKQNSYCCAPIETAALALTMTSHQANNQHSHSRQNSMSSKTQSNTNEMLKQQQQQHLQFQQQGYGQQPCQSSTLPTVQDNGCSAQENNPFINYPSNIYINWV